MHTSSLIEYRHNSMPTSWEYQHDHRYISMGDYISRLFNRYARLLVIRVDLAFKVNMRGQYDAEYCRDCFQRFMNNQRFNRSFDNKVGYIWRLEYGHDRGFHYHVIFFYDGSKSQQDAAIGHLIGQYWCNSITEGTGCYYCSNDNKEQLMRQGHPVGIGMIHRDDFAMRSNLIHVSTYLLKEDEHLQKMLPDSHKRFRVFGHGELL